jgi:hypothetical protein
MKYVSKPSYVEAILVSEALKMGKSDFKSLPDWLKQMYDKGDLLFTPRGLVYQENNGGRYYVGDSWKTAKEGYYFVKSDGGRIDVIDQKIFDNYYVPYNEDDCEREG